MPHKRGVGGRRRRGPRRRLPKGVEHHHQRERPGVVVGAIALGTIGQIVRGMLKHAGRVGEPPEVIEHERDRVYEQLGVDEGHSPGRVRTLREWITVDGEPVPVQLHEELGGGPGSRTVWAGRLLVHGSVLLLCGRGIEPADVELRHLNGRDHDRFITGRTELLRQVELARLHRRARARRGQAALTGLDAHRLLVEASVERALAEGFEEVSVTGSLRVLRRA